MADSKLSALAALTGATVAVGDLFYVDDVSVTTSKSITAAEMRIAVGPQLGTEQASTSGTEIDFTGIPAGVKRITIMFKGVSTNGTSIPLIQIGDAGGFEATGYLGSSSFIAAATAGSANFTTGFGFNGGAATTIFHGSIVLNLENSAAFSWVANGALGWSDSATMLFTAGSKSLTAELTQVRITTLNGTDAFDAGAINIQYE